MPAAAPTTTESGEAVRTLRVKRGLTQMQFAAKIGKSQGTVSRVESGDQALSPEIALLIERRFKLRQGSMLKFVDLGGWLTLELQAA